MFRKDNKPFFALMAFILTIVILLFANDHIYSNANRELFLSPRNMGLGGADLLFETSGTPQTNASIIGLHPLNSVMLSYAGYFDNAFSTSIASYSGKIDESSGFSLALCYLLVPNIPNYNNFLLTPEGHPIFDSSRVTMFTASEYFVRFAFSKSFLISRDLKVALAASANTQRRRLTPQDIGYGIGTDGGIVIEAFQGMYRAGLTIENLTTSYLRWDSNNYDIALPRAFFAIGLSKDIPSIYGKYLVIIKTPDLLSNSGALIIRRSVLSKSDSTFFSAADTVETLQKLRPSQAPWLFLLASTVAVEYYIRDRIALRIGLPPINISHLVFDGEDFTEYKAGFGVGINLFKRAITVDLGYLVHYAFPGTYQLGVTYSW